MYGGLPHLASSPRNCHTVPNDIRSTTAPGALACAHEHAPLTSAPSRLGYSLSRERKSSAEVTCRLRFGSSASRALSALPMRVDIAGRRCRRTQTASPAALARGARTNPLASLRTPCSGCHDGACDRRRRGRLGLPVTPRLSWLCRPSFAAQAPAVDPTCLARSRTSDSSVRSIDAAVPGVVLSSPSRAPEL